MHQKIRSRIFIEAVFNTAPKWIKFVVYSYNEIHGNDNEQDTTWLELHKYYGESNKPDTEAKKFFK